MKTIFISSVGIKLEQEINQGGSAEHLVVLGNKQQIC